MLIFGEKHFQQNPMKTVLSNKKIVLKPLTIKDSKAFYNLYFLKNNSEKEPSISITKHKSPLEFTEHIISLCNKIFTIRTSENPTKIIGDCALHDLNQEKNEIEIGGTLLPEYWGKGIMAIAFQLLIELAKQEYSVDKIVAKTEITNPKALKFAEKIGFKKIDTIETTVILEKKLK